MYADPLDILVGESHNIYARYSIGTNQSLYTKTSSTEDIRDQLRIIHSTGARDKKDPNFIQRRHVFTLSRDEYVAALGRHEVATLNVTLAHPNTSTISRAELDAMIGQMRRFFEVTDNVDKFLRNEL